MKVLTDDLSLTLTDSCPKIRRCQYFDAQIVLHLADDLDGVSDRKMCVLGMLVSCYFFNRQPRRSYSVQMHIDTSACVNARLVAAQLRDLAEYPHCLVRELLKIWCVNAGSRFGHGRLIQE